MKKLISFILIAILLCGVMLSACGEAGDASSPRERPDSGGRSSGLLSPREKETDAPDDVTEDDRDEEDTGADPFGGEDDITLTVWTPDAAAKITEQLCNDFVAMYPDKTITIKVEAVESSDAAAKLLNEPKTKVDVFGFGSGDLNRLYAAGVLEPAADPDRITARSCSPAADAAVYDGKLQAYPQSLGSGYYLVYDKSEVSDGEAKTLEGVLAACRRAKKKFVIDADNGYFACMFPFTGGLRPDGISGGVQQFNLYDEDEVVDTLQAFSDLFHEYSDVFMSGDTGKISAGFSSQNRTVAAGIDGSWNAAACVRALGSDLGVAKLPTVNVKGDDRQMISMTDFRLTGVSKYSAFPKASQLLADFLSGEDAQITLAKELGWAPAHTAAAFDVSIARDEAIQAQLAQAEDSVPYVDIESAFWSPMGQLGGSLWKSDVTTRQTIKHNFITTIDRITAQ